MKTSRTLVVVGFLALSIAAVKPAWGVIIERSPEVAASSASPSRDKCWTSEGTAKSNDSQAAFLPALTSRVTFLAEGTGFEPATGFPASHFELRPKFSAIVR